MDDIFNTPLSKELAELLYTKLKESEGGELSFNEILDIYETKIEYGLNRVNGGAIHIIRKRKDVIQLKDENGRPYLKII